MTESTSNSFNLLVLPVNDAPVAFNISVDTDEDNGIIVDLLAEDVDSDTFTASIVTQPEHGSVALQDNDLSILYQPFGNYNGTDSIEYKIYDDELAVSNTANISIDINDVSIIYGSLNHDNSLLGSPYSVEIRKYLR